MNWRELHEPMTAMKRHTKSRKRLEQAVARYVNLQGSDGSHNVVVHTTDRTGKRVAVFVEMNILSDED